MLWSKYQIDGGRFDETLSWLDVWEVCEECEFVSDYNAESHTIEWCDGKCDTFEKPHEAMFAIWCRYL